MSETHLLISIKAKVFHVKENKFCSEKEWYNCWNPQISVQQNFNSLLHFVQEQNYQWWKRSPKRKQCVDLSSNPFISLSPAVFQVLTSLALFYFKSHSSYFMESFPLPDSRSGGWNFREYIGPFPCLDFTMFPLQVCCMKIVCIINQQGTALLIGTRLSKFYKSKNAHWRCDISSRGSSLWFLTTFKNAFVHISLQEFALCCITSKKWWVTSKMSPSEPCQKQRTYGEPQQGKVQRTTDQVSPGWSLSLWNYRLQCHGETLTLVLGECGE